MASDNLKSLDGKLPRGSIYRKQAMAEDALPLTHHATPKVEVNVSCRHLNSSITDTSAVITISTGSYVHDPTLISTEIQHGTCDPKFKASAVVDYRFEERQTVSADIYAHLQNNNDETEKKLIGSAACSLGVIIHNGGYLNVPLSGHHVNGNEECIFHVIEYVGNKANLMLKLSGINLDKKDLFGKSDPYLVIERKNDRGKSHRAYRTEVIKNTLNPDWRPIKVSIDRLCCGDYERELCFRCYDWDGADGDPPDMDIEFDEFIGQFTTKAKDLLSNKQEMQFELINPRKLKKKKNYVNSGVVTLRNYSIEPEFTFLDYMFGGTDLCFTVAVDMTASNGDVRQATSLHYTDPNTPNQYTIAMQAVLEIIQDYDSDQLLPAFGFGVRAPPDYKVCHEYPLNGDASNPFCKGADGVLEAYRRCLQLIRLSGPTCFAPVIRNVSRLARNHQNGSRYFVLLILTDGTIDDWIDTKKAVIEASYLAVSIIVIGIGSGNFVDMVILDQDQWLLEEGRSRACRDIVQFVEMQRYLRPAADGSESLRWSKVALAKDVLAELPTQILEYFQRRRLTPKHTAAAVARDQEEIRERENDSKSSLPTATLQVTSSALSSASLNCCNSPDHISRCRLPRQASTSCTERRPTVCCNNNKGSLQRASSSSATV